MKHEIINYYSVNQMIVKPICKFMYISSSESIENICHTCVLHYGITHTSLIGNSSIVYFLNEFKYRGRYRFKFHMGYSLSIVYEKVRLIRISLIEVIRLFILFLLPIT